MLFTDKNGMKFKITLRSAYLYIKNQKQLKAILEKSIDAKSENLRIAYRNKSYMNLMREWGVLCTSQRIIEK